MNDDRMREEDVMERLNVSQKRLRTLRRENLVEGAMHGRDAAGYWFTAEAVAVLEAARDRGEGEALPLNGQAPREPEADGTGTLEDLRITRQWPERGKVVVGRLGSGSEVVCKVQDSKLLRPGMLLKGCRLGQFGIWYYTGVLPKRVRDPRFPISL